MPTLALLVGAVIGGMVLVAILVEVVAHLLQHRRVKNCEVTSRERCPSPRSHLPNWYRRYTG